MSLPSILEAAHHFAGAHLESGAFAIDATVGNGHDTLFLLRTVAPEGRVMGFDIQMEALAATRKRVRDTDPALLDCLELVHAGHETMADRLTDEMSESVGTVMFNLGYLPGGDPDVITSSETTLEALRGALELLHPRGTITLVAYPGHEGGAEETRSVHAWAAALPHAQYQALSYDFLNPSDASPRLIVVQKRAR